MVSYLDVLTILLILFVAMAAHLQSAPKKETVKAPTQAPTADTSGRSSMASIREDLEQNGLDVRQDSRGVVVSLPQALLFGPGEDRINEDALATVSAIGDVLGKISNNVSVVGHADAVPGDGAVEVHTQIDRLRDNRRRRRVGAQAPRAR